MPDIIPLTPTAQPTSSTSTSSNSNSNSNSTPAINAQFLNAVTRGDEHYARSLLARGADVNATDAGGRSAVACVVAGERYAGARGEFSGEMGLNAGPPTVGRLSILHL